MKIFQNNNELLVQASNYRLRLDSKGLSELMNVSGERLFAFPLCAWIKTNQGKPLTTGLSSDFEIINNTVIAKCKNSSTFQSARWIFNFHSDRFTCKLEIISNVELKPSAIEYFREAELGMRLNGMIEGFCTPKAPKSNEDYHDIFPMVSIEGLASPPAQMIGMRFAHGYVAAGLLDFSNACNFGVSHPYMGLAVDSLAGQITWGPCTKYIGPEVVIYFPSDGWNGLAEFPKMLAKEKRLPKEYNVVNKPDWWKKATYCTYGDQIMEMQPALYTADYWDAPGFTEKWVEAAVLRAEEKLGYQDFTVIIDAFWQRRWDTDPTVDPVRFPNLRALIEKLHDRGHKVLLWYSPHVLLPKDGRGSIAQKYGVVGKCPGDFAPETVILDYTTPKAADYIKEICRKLFSDEPDCLNCDGLKMDFLFAIPSTEKNMSYIDPQNGMGMKMIENYLKYLKAGVEAIKPDAMINYSSADPRLSHLFSINRLHDTKVSAAERERRARVSSLTCPNLLIDSDGAVMMSEWVAPTYLAAAIYSTPSLYYIDVFNDFIRLPDSDMKTLGRLFEIASRRFWGHPEYQSIGNWLLRDAKDAIIGACVDGAFCWLLTEKDTAEGLGFTTQCRSLNFPGRTIAGVEPRPEGMQREGDRVTGRWLAGVAYHFYFHPEATQSCT